MACDTEGDELPSVRGYRNDRTASGAAPVGRRAWRPRPVWPEAAQWAGQFGV
jgi:hypothetical protein